jgi:hypothetical protein
MCRSESSNRPVRDVLHCEGRECPRSSQTHNIYIVFEKNIGVLDRALIIVAVINAFPYALSPTHLFSVNIPIFISEIVAQRLM